ncbi:hypothetical protein ACS8E9_17230 [Pseudomonas neustonica]|uniref:hypothetical protein n=1 Tax=Pseudomonas neustonica TaxID=2487346 RepID=UPI003F45CDBD|tara:strand:- start:164 stop:436 length:273 start_codon:yes stop_codon:yes gene_type:complete
MNETKREAFIKHHVSASSPVPCDFKMGDVVTVINGYGIEIKGKRILGFVQEVDPKWRPDAIIYLDWDCYWFAVEVDRLTLESKGNAAPAQ